MSVPRTRRPGAPKPVVRDGGPRVVVAAFPVALLAFAAAGNRASRQHRIEPSTAGVDWPGR